jgi:hypothetical protein
MPVGGQAGKAHRVELTPGRPDAEAASAWSVLEEQIANAVMALVVGAGIILLGRSGLHGPQYQGQGGVKVGAVANGTAEV